MAYRRTATIPIFTIKEIKRMAKKQLSGKWRRLFPVMLVYMLLVTVPTAVVQIVSYFTEMSNLAALAGTDLTSGSLPVLNELSLSGITAAGTALSVLSLYIFLTAGPFSMSMADLSLRVLRNEEFSIKTIFSGFSRFGKTFSAYLLITIFSALWTLVFVFPGSILVGAAIVVDEIFILTMAFMILFVLMIAAAIFLMRYEMTFFLVSDDDYYTGGQSVTRSVRMMKNNLSNLFALKFSFLPWILLLCVPCALAGAAATAASGSTGTYAVIASILAVFFSIIAFIADLFLTLYMQTASAVFYSGASGNFRSSALENDTTVADVVIPMSFLDADGAEKAEEEAIRPFTDSYTEESSVLPQNDDIADRSSDLYPDETLSILENDDSLDHLYDEDDLSDE